MELELYSLTMHTSIRIICSTKETKHCDYYFVCYTHCGNFFWAICQTWCSQSKGGIQITNS